LSCSSTISLSAGCIVHTAANDGPGGDWSEVMLLNKPRHQF
jgi:hypothetical protein